MGIMLTNNSRIALAQLPQLPLNDFVATIDTTLHGGDGQARVCAYFAHPLPDNSCELYCLLAHDEQHSVEVLRSEPVTDEFPSLAAKYPQIQLFEREIVEQTALVPVGHPWLKSVRFAPGLGNNQSDTTQSRPAIGDFTPYRVEGDEIHEVGVGPVHAGVIEPGHFRFQCHGEEVKHLEISLGYQHRGVEQMLQGLPSRRHLLLAETIAGDTTIGHGSAFCQLCETLSDVKVSLRAQQLRAMALELERLANHVGDVGALSGDTGFLTTASYCGSIRGNILNLSADICGNRFGRGLLRVGGVNFDLDAELRAMLLNKLDAIEKETNGAIALFYDAPSVLARMEGVGTVTNATAMEIGLVGPAARASGVQRDVRSDYPSAADADFAGAAVEYRGDVQARALVRRCEIAASFARVRHWLNHLDDPSLDDGGLNGDESVISTALLVSESLAAEHLAFSLVEGWRGEVTHVAITDAAGGFARYKVVDPSFHNWKGLELALRNQQISDFPLCNKSFNLSYCGFDL